jgi:hypothetical protein
MEVHVWVLGCVLLEARDVAAVQRERAVLGGRCVAVDDDLSGALRRPQQRHLRGRGAVVRDRAGARHASAVRSAPEEGERDRASGACCTYALPRHESIVDGTKRGVDLDRGSFLRLGALTLAEGLRSTVAGAAPAATPVGDDESFVAFGAVAEGVGAALYTRALHAGRTFDGHERKLLSAARTAKREHAATLQSVLGADSESAADFAETFPKSSLHSRAALLRLAERLERLVVGVYLSGIAFAADQNTRILLGELMAADVRQLTVIRMLRGLPPLDGALAPVDLEVAGKVLDRYLSSPDAPDEGNLG